jgi:murein DD-endopeptidase MepM/ murein hydrolase activator NlpD
MSYLASLVFILLTAFPAFAGNVTVEPAQVMQGGIVTIQYHGDQPRSAVVRLFDTPLFLFPTDSGTKRILGVDLATEPGHYQLPVRVETRSGDIEEFQLHLDVTRRISAVERLTLPNAMVTPKSPEILDRITRETSRLNRLFTLDTPPRFRDRLILPVADEIGSHFGLRRILNGQPRAAHSGVDFRSPRGRQVKAPAPAVVVGTGDYYFTGQTVILDHGGGLLSLFAHLEQTIVREGETVDLGQVVGTVGSSGRATGAHLHWSVRLNKARIDPLSLFEVFNRENP